MEFLTWRDSYTIGEENIDAQHQRLVALINALHEKIEELQPQAVVDKALIYLIKYAEEHFRDEEHFMKKIGYPEYETHKKEHERLVIEVFEFKDRYSKGLVSHKDMLIFLRNWLIDHVLGTDTKIRSYIGS